MELQEKTDEDQPLTEVKISDPNEGGAAGMLPNGAPANCSFRRKRNVSYMNAINQSVPNSVKDEFEFQFMRVLNKIYNTIERNEVKMLKYRKFLLNFVKI